MNSYLILLRLFKQYILIMYNIITIANDDSKSIYRKIYKIIIFAFDYPFNLL